MCRAIFTVLTILAVNVAHAADYDVLIRNGTVYDGSGAPGYAADIAIRGDRVVAIGQFAESSAELEIDADGLAVAPGWVNSWKWLKPAACRPTSAPSYPPLRCA